MKGTQELLTCPRCAKGFFAWRPADLPGARVKCYFCGNQFEDEAAQRPAAPPPDTAANPPAAAAPAVPLDAGKPAS